MNPMPTVIAESNLSIAWGRALIEVLDHPGTELSPLMVTIDAAGAREGALEDAAIRSSLDLHLASRDMLDTETVAWTIFPTSLWEHARSDRSRFFEMYRGAYPRYRALNPTLNGRGLYFGRLVDYGRGPCEGNQLEWIIEQHNQRRGVRRSMFQASVFDPAHDHVSRAQLGFPCLQHVQFVPAEGRLTVNAFYATQQLFDKAYGNWLGLCDLGAFMASEMCLQFSQLNCFIGVEKLERATKAQLQPLGAVVRAAIERAN